MKIFKHLNYKKLMWLIFFFLLPVGLAFNVNLVAPLTDSFHEGEYLGNLQTINNYYAGLSEFPILIHGAMDYIPALLASIIAGADHLLVWTRFLNVLTVVACWMLYLDFSRVVLREQPDKKIWGLLFFFLFVWMAIPTGDDPVKKQQAFLGTRDLFLMLSLWSGLRYFYCRRVFIAHIYLISSGALAGLSLYWSYDRGIMSSIWVISFATALLYQRKKTSALAIALGYTVALALISKSTCLGSLLENYRNIIYWVKNTGDIWFLPYRDRLPALPGALAMMVFGLTIIIHSLLKMVHHESQKLLPMVFGLIFIQLVFLTKMYSLPGFPTNYYFIWPSFLLLIITPPKSTLISGVNESLSRLFDHLNNTVMVINRADRKVLLGAGLLLLIICSNMIVSGLNTVRKLANPIPDIKLIDSRYGYNAAVGYKFDCVFLWSNEGVFSMILKKPYCTKYMSAVYISKGDEASVLKELKNNPPGLIVYDSPYWSMNIYGRHMRDRLPTIDLYIQENYVFHDAGIGYVFATPKSH